MLLGQLTAIALASNLFYLALFLSSTWPSSPSSTKAKFPPKTVPLFVSLPLLISLLTIAISPFTNERTFLPNLLLMHGLLFIPFLFRFPSPNTVNSTRFSINIRTLYTLITILTLAFRSKTIYVAFSSLPQTLPMAELSPIFNRAVLDTLYSHPAQSSIGWDVIWTTASFIIWLLIGSSNRSLSDILITLVGIVTDGVGVVAPWAFRKGIKKIATKKE